MSAHLVPGGVLVLGPWWFPDRFVDGSVGGGPGAGAGVGRTVARVSHSTRYGRVTRMEERWLVGDAAGIREFSQIGLLTMFTRAECLSAFAATGRDARYVEGWLSGRGLFVADRTGGGAACGDLDSDACKKLARPAIALYAGTLAELHSSSPAAVWQICLIMHGLM